MNINLFSDLTTYKFKALELLSPWHEYGVQVIIKEALIYIYLTTLSIVQITKH
jgi:hypothetical protein